MTLSLTTSSNDKTNVNSNKYQSQRYNEWANATSKSSDVQNKKDTIKKDVVEEMYFSASVCYF